MKIARENSPDASGIDANWRPIASQGRWVVRLAILGLGLAFAGWYGWQEWRSWQLATQGYCEKEGRYISDREFILKGIRIISGSVNYGKTDQEIAASLDKFPECCQLERVSNPSSPTPGVPYDVPYDVTILIQGPTRGAEDYVKERPFSKWFVTLTVCGDRIRELEESDPVPPVPVWYKNDTAGRAAK